jgi:hypothetical protein
MKSGALRRAIGLTFLYFGIFVAIVLVQFSRGPGLSETFGELRVGASFPKAARDQAGASPERVRLSLPGLRIELSQRHPALALATDGSTKPLALAGIRKASDGVRVELGSGAALVASGDRGPPGRVALAATVPDGYVALRLAIDSSSVRAYRAGGAFRVAAGGDEYSLAPGEGALDLDAGTLTIRPSTAEGGGFAMARIEQPARRPAKSPVPDATAVAQAPKDAAAFAAEIAAWRDKAWAGLSAGRFDADKVAWKGPDGVSSFSERSLVAYLAEAAARGSYAEAIARAKAARDRWPDRIGAPSATFIGGIVARMRPIEAADAAEVKRLAQLVADKSPAVLEREGLATFLVDRGPYKLALDALRVVASLDPAKLTVAQAVGLLGASLDAKALLKDEDDPLADGSAAQAAADRVVAAVRKTGGGFYLVSGDDGSSDLRLSAQAGLRLVAYGSAQAKPPLVGLGQALVEGAIALADAQGFMPARVLPKDGASDQRYGALAPEELYPLLAAGLAYPREESLAKSIGPGAWAWTCAPSLTAQSSASRITLTANFAAGRSHYMAVYGIKGFVNIQLYDVDYSPDADFESYDASGFLFEKARGALFLKMRHKKDSEDVKLAF